MAWHGTAQHSIAKAIIDMQLEHAYTSFCMSAPDFGFDVRREGSKLQIILPQGIPTKISSLQGSTWAGRSASLEKGAGMPIHSYNNNNITIDCYYYY